MYTVYQHKNKINGKVYIGITKQAPEERWNNGKKYKSSPHFYAAIQKYGWDNFEHNILFQNLTKEEACQKEQKLIQKLSEMAKKRHAPCSEQTRENIRKASHKKPIYCEELDKVFESVQDCCRQLGIPATNISKLCEGRGKTLRGYHLRYYDDDAINA